MYEFALGNWFYCCVYCDPYKSDFLISLLIFCFEPSAQLNWKPVPQKRGRPSIFVKLWPKTAWFNVVFWSAHTLVQKDVNRRPGGWSHAFPDCKDNDPFPFETPGMLVQNEVTFCDRSIDESCSFLCWGYIAIITQIGQPGWHNAFRPQMFQNTDMHMMILNILPLWKILNIHIKQPKFSSPETSKHSLYQRHFKASWCFWLIFPGAETPERLPQGYGMARMLTKLSKRHLLSLPLNLLRVKLVVSWFGI